jgi:predicted ATPase
MMSVLDPSCANAALDYQATGGEFLKPYFMALLAESLGKSGEVEAALAVLDEAQAIVRQTGENFYAPELYRLQGLFRLQQPSDAQACFGQAIALAAEQGSRSLELRAALDLARLLQQQGKQKQAYELLAARYDVLTEGFDTADLRAARALLEQLSQKPGANSAL